ncbi:S-adenosylmethionine decarboxylase [Xenorhabdus vietnamensis]|uniref:S-adenosylmethionine decarboxylase n=1 Tax=Xenorhabdus vietnamensis TaxID=351656 RepID=A0A1Y2SEJ6_9GAMM|nr:S-adenosylmethionine decarboxylase [Xenorhabdus vietnamensis]
MCSFTRNVNGVKHYIDHEISSIQNYVIEEIQSQYHMIDVNIFQENLFHTKMMSKEFDLNEYLFNTTAEELCETEKKEIIRLLKKIQEIYYGRNLPAL